MINGQSELSVFMNGEARGGNELSDETNLFPYRKSIIQIKHCFQCKISLKAFVVVTYLIPSYPCCPWD